MITAPASSPSATWRMNSTPSMPRHVDVAQDHVGRWRRVEQRQRGDAVVGLGHGADPEVAQQHHRGAALEVVVLDDEHRQRRQARRGHRDRGRAGGRSAEPGVAAVAARYAVAVSSDGSTPSSAASTSRQCS